VEANTVALDQTTFNPHVAIYNRDIDLSTTVLGHKISMPILTAPTGNNRILHPDGEIGVARAAGDANIISCISMVCGHPIEKIVAAAKGPVFFQLYYLGDRSLTEYAIERAKNAGCKAIIITVDCGGHIKRERPVPIRRDMPLGTDLKNILHFMPQGLRRMRWVLDFIRDGMQAECPMGCSREGRTMTMWEALEAIFSTEIPVPAWPDMKWIRDNFKGPIIIKGIHSSEDARRAVDCGAAAVAVSNHGGMGCDGAPGSLRMLPNVLEAVGHETEVLFDGGIRRGSDVVKAVALGARAVLLGHGYLYALAAAGEPGVRHQLNLFRAEMDQTMRYLGCPSVKELDRSYLWDYPHASVDSERAAKLMAAR
jgi:isopentenyl diphosphate isomerase/L-lactate dehydrogenase-like FMN-dependent dehydrogenase